MTLIDSESQHFLDLMGEKEKVRANLVPGVRTVLVVLSSSGVVFDVEALKQKILLAYPDTTVFFLTTSGKPIGVAPPRHVDLLIDFTGPGQRQGIFFPRKLRSMARLAVGRNAGIFRKRIYNRVFDEKTSKSLPKGVLERERVVQRAILALAGVTFVPMGDVGPDRGKTIALELPPLARA